ncbi:MAG: sugar ABC transporter permease, partial [Chloroflexi bacterium]
MALEVTPLDKRASHPSRTSRTLRSEALAPYLFILPFGVLFILFFILPIFYALYQSLYRSERSGLGLGAATTSFNGLGNYLDVLRDHNFYTSLGR